MKETWPVFIAVLTYFLFLPPSVSAQVKINEFLIRPNPEWVELYNASDSADYLKSYWLDDDVDFDNDSGSSPKKLLSGLKTDNVRFVYFTVNSFLNDDGDMVVLFDSQKNIIDSFQFGANPGDNLTVGRYPDENGGFTTLKEPTQGWANSPPQPAPASSPSTSLGVIDPSPSPAATTNSSQTSASSSPTGSVSPTPSPSPQASKIYRIKEINLLELSPEPVLGTATPQLTGNGARRPNWQLVIMLLTTGTGLLLSTAIIMIKLWRKN